MSSNNKLIQGNLGRDAKFYDGAVPKTVVSMATTIDSEKKWVGVTLTGKLAEDFQDLKKGAGITVEGELVSSKGEKGTIYTMDAEKAYGHKKIDLQANVAKPPKIYSGDNAPNKVFAIANVGDKAIPINITSWKDKEKVGNLNVGDKIQVSGYAVVIPNDKTKAPESKKASDTPGKQQPGEGKPAQQKPSNLVDFKYQMTNPTLLVGPEIAQAKNDGKENKAGKKPEGVAKKETDTKTEKPAAQQSGEFVAGTENHTLYKVNKTYEVIATGEGMGNKVVGTSPNGRIAAKLLKDAETTHQMAKGVEKPKIKPDKDTKRAYPKTVDRSAVTSGEASKSKKQGMNV